MKRCPDRLRRPGLDQALAATKPDDTLATSRLNPLGRSLHHLIELIAALQKAAAGSLRWTM